MEAHGERQSLRRHSGAHGKEACGLHEARPMRPDLGALKMHCRAHGRQHTEDSVGETCGEWVGGQVCCKIRASACESVHAAHTRVRARRTSWLRLQAGQKVWRGSELKVNISGTVQSRKP